MKRTERHRLKENEFARTVAHARDAIEKRQRAIALFALAVVVLLVVLGGFTWWRYSQNANANEMLASALAVHEAPVVPIPEPAPGSPAPVQQPGTYPTERARLDAALPGFLEAADRYPNTDAGIAARYHAAGILARLGRYAEAEEQYSRVAERAGSSIYGRTARLGLAEVQVAQGNYDGAIDIYTEISRDPGSQIPVESVLMQLGRAYTQAGRKEEAVRAYTRIVDEFPQSLYAPDARREMEEVKKS